MATQNDEEFKQKVLALQNIFGWLFVIVAVFGTVLTFLFLGLTYAQMLVALATMASGVLVFALLYVGTASIKYVAKHRSQPTE